MYCAFRRILTVAGLGVALALAGCGSIDPSDWLNFNKEKPIPGERKLVFPEGVPGVPEGVPPELVKGNQPPPVDPAMVAAAEESNEPAGQSQTIAPAASRQPAGQPQRITPAAATTSVAARSEAKPTSTPRSAAKPKPASAPKPAAEPKPKVAAKPKTQPKPKQAQKPEPEAGKSSQPAPNETKPEPEQSAQAAAQQSDPVWGPHPTRGASKPWPAPSTEKQAPAPWPEAPPPNTFSR